MTTARATGIYAAAVVALVLLIGWAMAMVFTGAGDAAAIRTSAVVAVVVQLIAFLFARQLTRHHLMLGWGVGMLLRFLALVVFAFVAVKAVGLPAAPALLSLAAFFFASTLVEPLLLRS